MGRSAQRRDIDPFHITPEFAGASSGDHFEGTLYRWEEQAGGYVRLLGELYYNLDREEKDPDVILTKDVLSDGNGGVGDDYYHENATWEIIQELDLGDFGLYFKIQRIIEGQKYDIWKVYNYKFLNWNFLREEKRKHV